MKPLLILKTGERIAQASWRGGDFEDWILEAAGLASADACVVDARHDTNAYPRPETLAGVIVTGSAAMVSERASWSEAAARWLAKVVEAETPVLGICFGHQLLAHALGGRVGRNPLGREIGTVEVHLTAAARDDALFGALPPQLRVQATHVESVLDAPHGARILATNAHDPHQALRFGRCAWGVQFHPELDARLIQTYIAAREGAIRQEGLNADALSRAAADSEDGGRLLRRFGRLLGGGKATWAASADRGAGRARTM
jgi:GMP synthase (glutamine-hydrolysing)